MYKIMFFLIMVLLLVVLLLTVSILTILLWSAIIFLGPYLKKALKREKSNGRNDRKPDPNGSLRTEAIPTSQNIDMQKSRVGQCKEREKEKFEGKYHDAHPYSESNQYGNAQISDSQDGQLLSVTKRRPESISSFQDRDLMDIIRGNLRENDIRLRSVKSTAKRQIGEKIQFTEASDGKLVIYKISEKINYVVPCKLIISAKEYDVGGIGACFETNIQLADGKQYEIISISRACQMIEEEGYYVIAEKGKLVLTEVYY